MLDCHGPTFHIVPSFHLVNRQIVADFDIFRAVELCRNSISTGSKLRRKDKTLCTNEMQSAWSFANTHAASTAMLRLGQQFRNYAAIDPSWHGYAISMVWPKKFAFNVSECKLS